ncbi:hypothetical protein INR49_004917 [Caranx melampygus]|nr:hypothetical protein INR49_004917 [Caranx melampygus]
MHLVKQGCWTHIGDQQECHGDRCLVTATPSQIQNSSYRFCCCSRDLCNANFTEAPPTADTPALRLMKSSELDDGQMEHQPLRREESVLVALATIAIAAILIMALFLGYRMMRGIQKHTVSALDVMEAANTESAVNLDNLKLLELIGRGRYGAVYRGRLNERCVAAKLFSSANRHNFSNERSIYGLPLMQHHNICCFLSADERTTADGHTEFIILMEYYPYGCLSQYLSLHTVDWLTCCRMIHGVTRALAFLHTELYRGDQYKPAVAHRDVTSRNVLVRADLSCVLADFGLSMRLTGSQPCHHGDDDTMAISEVGTVRYMAPEVLGGALNLRDCESALKQVDVYALGLLYWESFRRCSDLFPGDAAPEYELAFQAELGNHPSFEEMQVLVAREKHRPRFPEAWKENNLALRSLKETIEDCWDQDAEARLTAQCAEERVCELTLLSTHTAIHNHRNLSLGRWSPQVGSASSYIDDLQVGVVKNLQGDGHLGSVVRTMTSGTDGAEKNRNCINYERQQAQSQACSSSSDNSVSATLCTISEAEVKGGAVSSSVPVCLQLTEEDLEATKLHPQEVDKNLRESSDENLMEHSQKQFSSEPQASNLLQRTLQTKEVNTSVSAPQGELAVDAPPPSSVHHLPKQQNLPQRPTSLHLLPKHKESLSASTRLKLGKLKSNHRQVETGVAKMNTVTVVSAVEPHLVTTVNNNTGARASDTTANRVHPGGSGYNAGVPTLVTNSMMGRGRTNPAGPQLEEEDQLEVGVMGGGDSHLNLLNFSPDEHAPLLRMEQPPAESEPPPPLHHQPRAANLLSGHGSNSNNNNNRVALGSEVRSFEIKPERVSEVRDVSPEPKPHPENQLCSESPAAPLSSLGSDPAGPATSGPTSTPKAPPSAQGRGGGPDTGPCLQKSLVAEHPGPDPQTTTVTEASSPEPAMLRVSALDQVGQTKASRPERPSSLDLSSSCMSSDDVSLMDNGSLSASGEKIKRRVKTPYTLKKWRPASWVVSTDTALDPDFEFNTRGSSSSHAHFSTGLHRGGNIPKINQSKSSIAVFLVGGGATATTTSEPDGMTCF